MIPLILLKLLTFCIFCKRYVNLRAQLYIFVNQKTSTHELFLWISQTTPILTELTHSLTESHIIISELNWELQSVKLLLICFCVIKVSCLVVINSILPKDMLQKQNPVINSACACIVLQIHLMNVSQLFADTFSNMVIEGVIRGIFYPDFQTS